MNGHPENCRCAPCVHPEECQCVLCGDVGRFIYVTMTQTHYWAMTPDESGHFWVWAEVTRG